MSVTPLHLTPRLAKTPRVEATYSVEILNHKNEKVKVADPKATRALVALMNMAAVNHGAACHWGGPSAFAEIMSALHALMFEDKGREWYENFHFVNDAGHTENGLYALRANLHFGEMNFEKLWGFRSINSALTGHGESHINPEGVLVSNGPLGSGLPQAQGLAMADAVAKKKRTTICTISDGALMEGEAKESLAAIPGLALRGLLAPFMMVVSYNRTKLSGRIDKDSFSMDPTMDSLGTLGFRVIRVHQGHNLQAVYQALHKGLELAQMAPTTPVAVVVETVKGYGVKATEEAASGGHGYPLKKHDPTLVSFLQEIYKGEEVPSFFMEKAKELMAAPASSGSSSGVKKEKVQAGIARGLISAVEKGHPVFSIAADLQSSTGVASFHKACPDHFIEVGVAESNMLSVASGMSLCGYIPVVDTFAQFGVTKGNLPLTMAALSGAPMIAVFSHTGMQDAADGASHQATTYFAAVKAIPHTEIINCCCSGEAEHYMLEAVTDFSEKRKRGEAPTNKIFFLGREDYPVSYIQGAKFEWGKPYLVHKGEKPVTLVVASGPTVATAMAAAAELEKEGISIAVASHPFVGHPDTKLFWEWIKECQGNLITIEDHQLIGGMGETLVTSLVSHHHTFKYEGMGLDGHFGRSAYSAKELYDLYGIGVSDLVERVKKLARS